MYGAETIPHLFRTEYSRIVAVLCKRYGLHHLEAIEDIASDTFLKALQTWPFQGQPPNPPGWLHTVAINKSRNYFHRASLFQNKIAHDLSHAVSEATPEDLDLSESNIKDSQLRMLFAVCHPAIPVEAQVGLALRTLCGFGIDEIATAFLTHRDTIIKRLYRGREKLREINVQLDMPAEAEVTHRLASVLTTLYLLFNEGYYSETNENVIREDLCTEAMRLVQLLLENDLTNVPEAKALLALMCFHASRFVARKDRTGRLVLYSDQDAQLWDQHLIAKGALLLNEAAGGPYLSKYHLEATIAYWHTMKEDTDEKWRNILDLYNRLLMISYSPVAALNRTYALSRVKGKEAAILEAEKIKLEDNPYYFSLMSYLYKDLNKTRSRLYLEKAIDYAATEAEKDVLRQQLLDNE